MKKGFCRSALFTDLYELTMAAVYFEREMFAPATFSFFIRSYPVNRRFFVACGVEEVLSFLENFRFQEEELAYLEGLGLFKPRFLEFLARLRFTGEVYAMEEGTIFFAGEPLLEITAPIIEAQLIETFVINALCFETLIASKAIRSVIAAKDRVVVDFSARRTHGVDAALKVARASYLAGFSATSNTLAGKIYGIPVTGTMAHSFIESFPSEIEAFSAFAEVFPENTVLLLDTYDTLAAARKAVQIAKKLEAQGKRLKGVRLDSGDLVELSRKVREILDAHGLDYVKIFASGGLDEYKIAEVLAKGAPIDAFGVGTKMGVSADAPYLDAAYKLVSYDGRPVTKLSSGKKTLAGAKQVFRREENGLYREDFVGLREETLPEATPLLKPLMKGGERCAPARSLEEVRKRVKDELSKLPEPLKEIHPGEVFYPVRYTEKLLTLQRQIEEEIRRKELGL
ncbi:MAG: nicotinate phosphoribosyltransferase [Thermodesulfobacteria bacterium]|nr:nicotinate phosphoribosyltransferase [Thermodesulfobacteriota bacterium]